MGNTWSNNNKKEATQEIRASVATSSTVMKPKVRGLGLGSTKYWSTLQSFSESGPLL